MRKYEAWETEDGATFFLSADIEKIKSNPAEKLVEKLFDVEAATWEEAMSIYNLRMGFGPYIPEGDPENCPRCDSFYYPRGSGVCWKCGEIC